MSRRALLAMSGWGKSYHGQAIMEAAADAFESMVVLDYKDEYRGLVKAGLASHYIVGPKETAWGVAEWRTFLEPNPKVVLARYQLGSEDWREVCARIIAAARDLAGADYPTLVAVDEAHVVAPQKGTVPEATNNLATTGRGEGASSLWMDQRPAKLEKDVLSQADETIIGGFMNPNDRNALSTEYPTELHNPQAGKLRPEAVPDHLHADDEGPVPLRKFTDDSGSTVGSEWIYANEQGETERRDTRGMTMETTHHGPEGHDIPDPDY